MRVLLTGARAPATLELARLGARAGFEVHVADTGAWHICRGSRLIAASHTLPAPRDGHTAYATALNRLTRRHRFDVIVPTCEEVFHLAAIRDQLDIPVACEPRARLAPLHDKWRFVESCTAAGLHPPRSHLFDRTNDLRSLQAGPYILKPRFSRFATRVRTWQSNEALPPIPDSEASQWMAQEFLAGAALCTWSSARHGRLLAHTTYAVDETAGPRGAAIAFRSVRHMAVRQWVEKFVAFHGLSGQFAFDFIDGAKGVRAIECNPRLTSGIHCFRAVPAVAATVFAPEGVSLDAPLEPAEGLRFRSRLALLTYGKPRYAGHGLLDDAEDPWPRRLQALSWADLLARSLIAMSDPRRLSTSDIEWNGE